jgi:hypothetical protein
MTKRVKVYEETSREESSRVDIFNCRMCQENTFVLGCMLTANSDGLHQRKAKLDHLTMTLAQTFEELWILKTQHTTPN